MQSSTTNDRIRKLSSVNRVITSLTRELDIALDTIQLVNETTQVNMRKLIETIPKPVPEEKLVEKAVTEIVKQDAEQLPTIAPVLKDVQPTIPATSKTILPTIVSAESKLKSRTTLKTRERSKSAKSEPSQKTKDKLSLDSILNQAKLIRNKESKKDVKQPEVKPQIEKKELLTPPEPINTAEEPTQKQSEDTYWIKLKKYHKLMAKQQQQSHDLFAAQKYYLKSMQMKNNHPRGSFDVSLLCERSKMFAVYEHMGAMQNDLEHLFPKERATCVNDAHVATSFFKLYKQFNDSVVPILSELEGRILSLAKLLDDDSWINQYEMSVIRSVADDTQITPSDPLSLYRDIPSAYISRWLPKQIPTGTESSVFDMLFPEHLAKDFTLGQYYMPYEDVQELQKIHELRHDIQVLILRQHIRSVFEKELLPMLDDMRPESDESILTEFMYLWRLLHFVLVDTSRLTMFVRKN